MSNDANDLVEAKQVIRTLIETLKEDGQFGLDVVTDALQFLRKGEPPVRMSPTVHNELLILGKSMVSIRLNEGMPCLPPFGPIRPRG